MIQIMKCYRSSPVRRLQSWFLLLQMLLVAGSAWGQAPFYQGKTIKFLVGTAPGDLYDQWARAVVPALAKNLPGAPDALVQNMPGTGHRVAAIFLFVLAPGAFGRPMIEPPGLPADRLRLLREAYSKALQDPAVMAYAKKLDWHIEAKSGEELQAQAKKVIEQPADVIARMKTILGE